MRSSEVREWREPLIVDSIEGVVAGRIVDARIEKRRCGFVIRGDLYSDTRGRFCDGDHVRTDLLVEQSPGRVRTLDRLYNVEWAEGQPSYPGSET